ncbi:MAG: lipopolysaccharide biosynthesis protein [Geminicoccaceae bacterium]
MRDELDSEAVRAAPPDAIRGPLSLTQRLIRGGGWALLGRTVALPIGLFQAMLLARLLEPAEVGAYFLALSLITVLALLAQVGMSRPMVKLVASALATDRPHAARHAIRVGMVVTLAVGGVLAIGLADGPGRWLISVLRDGERLGAMLPILALMVLAFALMELAAETLRGFQDLRSASAFGDYLAQRLLLVLILAVLWWSGRPSDLALVLTAALAAAAAVLVAAFGSVVRHVTTLGRHGEPWSIAEILRHGAPFMLVRLTALLWAGADLWVLAAFRPTAEVGVYAAASRMAMLVGIPLAVCNAVLAPVIAELHSRNEKDRLQKVIRAAATLGALPSLLVVALFLAFGDRLLGALFTEAYGAGYWVALVLALGQCVNVAFGPSALVLIMTGHQRDVVAASAVVAAAAALAFYLVAEPYGAVGVAVVAASSLALYNVLLSRIARRRLGIATWGMLSLVAFRRLASELSGALGRPR